MNIRTFLSHLRTRLTQDGRLSSACSRRRISSIAALMMVVGFAECPSSAFAGATFNATITEISIDPAYGDWVWIKLSVAQSPAASCVTAGLYWHYTFPLTDSPVSKAIYAALLAAQMSGRTVIVTGTGLCSQYGGVESLRGFNVLN